MCHLIKSNSWIMANSEILTIIFIVLIVKCYFWKRRKYHQFNSDVIERFMKETLQFFFPHCFYKFIFSNLSALFLCLNAALLIHSYLDAAIEHLLMRILN